jgi:catechol 2,3-dioxygenase-like lactoylglutathione lyase family enzyme
VGALVASSGASPVAGPVPPPPAKRDPGLMIDHVTLQVADVPTSRAFYEAVLAPLGFVAGANADDGPVVGFFGPDPGSFWLVPAQREQDRELHLAFRVADRDTVRAFHRAAVSIGAEILHAPGVFPEYHEHYFAAFVRDPDGHNIEAVCHTPGR